MANAFGFSRMALASARAFPLRCGGGVLRAAGGGAYRGGTFGARMPASRLFALPSNNGNGRGVHTSTAATPKDRAGAANAKAPAPAAVSAARTKHAEQVTELTFAPFDEVKKPLEEMRESEGRDVSLAREEGYSVQLEEAVNHQINIELTIRCASAPCALTQRVCRAWTALRARAHRSTHMSPGPLCAATSTTACTPTSTATMWRCAAWRSTSARCLMRSASTRKG